MIDSIIELFSGLPDWLYVFVISMLPIVELRGAIPVGAGIGLEYYLSYVFAVLGNMLPVPFILLFIPAILNFMARFRIFKPVVEWLHKKAHKHSKRVLKNEEKDTPTCDASVEPCAKADADALESSEKAEATVNADAVTVEEEAVTETAERAGKREMPASLFVALLLFVAIPLPGTGAWTGGLVASLFNFPFKKSFLAILLGVITSGIIMTLVSYGFVGFLSFLL